MTATLSSGHPSLAGPAQALLDAVSAISSDLDLNSVLTRIVVAATELTGARYGALGVIGSDGRLVEFLTTGLDEATRALIGDLPHGDGILGVHHRGPVRPASGRTWRPIPGPSGFPPNHPPMTTFLGMPVRIRGTVFGNLYLTEKARRAALQRAGRAAGRGAGPHRRARHRQRAHLRPQRAPAPLAGGDGRARCRPPAPRAPGPGAVHDRAHRPRRGRGPRHRARSPPTPPTTTPWLPTGPTTTCSASSPRWCVTVPSSTSPLHHC